MTEPAPWPGEGLDACLSVKDGSGHKARARRHGARYSRTMPWHRLEDSNKANTDLRKKRRFVTALFFSLAGVVTLWFLGYLLAGFMLH